MLSSGQPWARPPWALQASGDQAPEQSGRVQVSSPRCTARRALVQTRDFRWCCTWLRGSPEERSVLSGAVSLTCTPAGSDGPAASATPDTPQQRPNWRPSQENWECPRASEENPPHSLLAEGCHLREPGLPRLCDVAGLDLPASVSPQRPFVMCLEVLSRAWVCSPRGSSCLHFTCGQVYRTGAQQGPGAPS